MIKKKVTKKKVLKGKRIVLTRPKEAGLPLKEALEALGAEVLEMPLIDIKGVCLGEIMEEVMSTLGEYSWVLFTSMNGVKYFFDAFFAKYKDLRCLGGMRIGCVGKKTAEEVEKLHLQVDLVPETATAMALGDALMGVEYLDSLKVLIVGGNLNGDGLRKRLEFEGNAIVDVLEVYKNEGVLVAKTEEGKIFREEGADGIVFTCGSAVKSFIGQARELQLKEGAKHPLPISIGPSTSSVLKEVGMTKVIEAKEQSVEGIVEVIVEKMA